MEEAAQIGADGLERIFNANLGGTTIHMMYIAGFRWVPGQYLPDRWGGSIMPAGGDTYEHQSKYFFWVNAETRELININFGPEAEANARDGISVMDTFDLFDFDSFREASTFFGHQGEAFARVAMDIAEGLNLFDSAVTRARPQIFPNNHQFDS